MVKTVVLRNATARAEVIPELGAGIARLDARGRAGIFLPVLRPWNGDEASGPFALACNLLAPFSNRISGGGFEFAGDFHPIAPNLNGERYPIHGDAFQRRWHCVARSDTHVLLGCKGQIGPFRYHAQFGCALGPRGLTLELILENLSSHTLPYGIGFHPWFPRGPFTQIQFEAVDIWLEDSDHLPRGRCKIAEIPDWNFTTERSLPPGWINNAFGGWSGKAVITQGEDAISVKVSASSTLAYALLFSPGAQSDFFCFEPVSHPVDAHNLPGYPGLHILARHERLAGTMTLDWNWS